MVLSVFYLAQKIFAQAQNSKAKQAPHERLFGYSQAVPRGRRPDAGVEDLGFVGWRLRLRGLAFSTIECCILTFTFECCWSYVVACGVQYFGCRVEGSR